MFYSVYDSIMPYTIDDVSSSLEIIAEFPEIKKHYGGHGTAVNMSVTVTPASGKFLSIDTKNGISFGKDDDLYVTMEMYCSNLALNLTSELCVVFDIKTQFWMNVTVSGFDVYLLMNDAILDSVTITKDIVGMKDRDYTRVLQHILNYAIANFNFIQATPISLNTTNIFVPIFQEFVSLRVDPYVQDEFLWIGIDTLSTIQPMPVNNATNSTKSLTSSEFVLEEIFNKKFLNAIM
jgi:hypothetical protein